MIPASSLMVSEPCTRQDLIPVGLVVSHSISLVVSHSTSPVDNHAFFALKKAGETKNEQDLNSEKLNVELSKNQSSMAELEWYKTRCKDTNTGYYDAFQQHYDRKDFHVNLARSKLGAFWNEIVDMEERHVVPSDFRSRNKWIIAGTAYRRLVEPLDIAYHYRILKESKSYL